MSGKNIRRRNQSPTSGIPTGTQELTDRDTTVGTTEVDVALRDGSHPELVEGPAEERGKGAGKYHVSVPHSTAYRHAHLQIEREGGKERERERARESTHSYPLLFLKGHSKMTLVFHVKQ